MKVSINAEVMDFTIDPLNGFEGIKDSKLFEATGLIPYFVAEAALTDPMDGPETAKEILGIMNEAYGFGLGDYNMLDDAGEVSSEGLYTYPGDPDMAPMVEFKFRDITVWVYQYALVAVRDGEGNTIMQRMD